MASAFAPATVANVAVGFDLLGFSFSSLGDIVHVNYQSNPTVVISRISGVTSDLPLDSKKNTATAGLLQLIADKKLTFGFDIQIEKGIPLGSGLGGSAASAVAALVAANTLLNEPLLPEELLPYILLGEMQASGSLHADNAAPALLGGLVMTCYNNSKLSIQSGDQANSAYELSANKLPHVRCVKLPLPQDVYCVVILPECRINTRAARKILKETVAWEKHLSQLSNLGQFMSACYQNDLNMLAHCLKDEVVEPQRAHLIPGFASVKQTAIEQGALGCSISGSGPCVFAWARDERTGEKVRRAMIQAFENAGLNVFGSWCQQLNESGARILS